MKGSAEFLLRSSLFFRILYRQSLYLPIFRQNRPGFTQAIRKFWLSLCQKPTTIENLSLRFRICQFFIPFCPKYRAFHSVAVPSLKHQLFCFYEVNFNIPSPPTPLPPPSCPARPRHSRCFPKFPQNSFPKFRPMLLSSLCCSPSVCCL